MFEAQVKSDIPLKSVRFEWVNGGETRGKDLTVGENELTKSIQQQLRLMPGENVIKLIAVNNKGGQVSSTRSVLSGKDDIADAVDINRKDYALIIATDSYDNFTDLVNPINDSKTIDAILKEKYGFQT